MIEKDLLYASDEDKEFYFRCIQGLPIDPGYSCGAHSVRALREIISLTQPKNILEIGTNVCYSASMWLTLSPHSEILTADISSRPETIKAVEHMLKSSKRFRFLFRDGTLYDRIKDIDFTLIFIDGGHLYDDVITDIGLALSLNIPWLAFDDILEIYGPGVQPAINQFPQLEHVMTNGNIALYKNTAV